MYPVNPASKSIAVLGAGSWGTALALLLARNGHAVTLWGRNAAEIKAMKEANCNTFYLPSISFPANLKLSSDLKETLTQAEFALITTPSSGFRSMLEAIKPYRTPIIGASKGIEPVTYKLLHHVVAECLGENYPAAFLSGPSFALEVAKNLPTAVVIASHDAAYAQTVIQLFANPHFRPYFSDDIIGVEIGGVVKNVMAIAAGIADGLGFGANTRAALLTRGLNEIMRLGVALGARPETFVGLSGLGDLILTATDNLSRNRRFGLAIGQGKTSEQAFTEIGQVVEGALNVEQVMKIARDHQIDMPITQQVYKILKENADPRKAVETLLTRDLKAEN